MGGRKNPASRTISQINLYYQAIWYHEQMYVYRKDLLPLKLLGFTIAGITSKRVVIT